MSNNGKRLYIKEEVTDWKQEAMRHEIIIEKEEDIIKELVEHKTPTPMVARATIIARIEKKVPENIIAPNKLLLITGAENEINRIMDKRRSVIQTPKGRFSVNTYVGKLPMSDRISKDEPEENLDEPNEQHQPDLGPSYTIAGSQLAGERAVRALNRLTTGRAIRDKLLHIHEAGGDIRSVVENFKRQLDELVDQII